MERITGKVCPECGKKILGRSDKIYCSDECRTFASNRRARFRRSLIAQDRVLGGIGRDLVQLSEAGAGGCVKLIAAITAVCKIIYKFGHQK